MEAPKQKQIIMEINKQVTVTSKTINQIKRWRIYLKLHLKIMLKNQENLQFLKIKFKQLEVGQRLEDYQLKQPQKRI